MSPHVIYNITTGVIDSVLNGAINDEVASMISATQFYVATSITIDPNIYRVSTGTISIKPNNTASLDKTTISADGIDIATISPIPATTLVLGSGPAYNYAATITDGDIEFTTNATGTYHFKLYPQFPYLGTEFTINAT